MVEGVEGEVGEGGIGRGEEGFLVGGEEGEVGVGDWWSGGGGGGGEGGEFSFYGVVVRSDADGGVQFMSFKL